MTEYTLAVSQAEVQRYRLMAAQGVALEADLWQQAGIVAGAAVADVGCGPAAAAVELAIAVGPTGTVAAVERDDAALHAAEAVIAAANVANVRLVKGDATATGLDADSFDVVVMRHVLAHNGGVERRIVDHLATLVRPGGCVYLVDVDLTAIRLRGAAPGTEDLLERYAEFHRRRGNDPMVGLRLGELLAAAGLDVETHQGRYSVISAPPGMRPPAWAAREAMVADGVVTEDDVRRWQDAFERSDQLAERPTIFAPAFLAIGRRQ